MKGSGIIIAAGLLALVGGCKSTKGLDVVGNFDAERYMGVWYEAVRYPHRFEKGMVAVSATYSLNEDGTIKVINRGFKNGKKTQIEGAAKFKAKTDRGWLKVSFFKPFYASYKVIYLDDDYTEAMVTGPTYGYFWILVRNPAIAPERLDRLIERAKALGFDEQKMIRVDQRRNRP
ncbi:lipocalin family protein [Pontiella sp.]|uniref:lipocalin family protein n=1 Tax=Pontiella sp. TaxID=2837462 RepID=UPI003563A8F0